MSELIFLIQLKPIYFGLIGIILSGISFPLSGVIILQNNLISLRYTLMHGVILGGIFSIVFNLPIVPLTIFLNFILILLIFLIRSDHKNTFSTSSATIMVITMGLASLLSHVFNVPAKDTLELLWGSPFALTLFDLIILFVISILIILYISIYFTDISMCFYDEDIAKSLGVKSNIHNFFMIILVSIVISIAMKMIGALLIDALLILPVLGARQNAKSLKTLFIESSIIGCSMSVISYFISLILNIPLSGILAIIALIIYFAQIVVNKLKYIKKKY